jgi:2-polyprenyl-3-methyl-5-hydroxy-6-metoxy-1,4-benzoquinol methylase
MVNAHHKDYGYTSSAVGWAHGYLLPALLTLLGSPRGAILDLGCGNGAIANALLLRGYDVYGVDSSATGITIANVTAPGRFHVMDIASGQLPPALSCKTLDTVISTEVIEHLYDPRALLRLAHAILPPNGHLLLSTPYHGYLKNIALAMTGKLDQHFTALWDGGHIKFFSRSTLEQLLRELGFDVEAFMGAGRVPLLWKSMLVKARAA